MIAVKKIREGSNELVDHRSSRLHSRARVLRRHETFCYRIAFSLLQNEEWAVKAAENSFHALILDDSFYLDSDNDQREKVKDVTVKCSLALYRQQATQTTGS